MTEEPATRARRDPVALAVALGLLGFLLVAAWLLGPQPLSAGEASRVFDAGGPSEAFRASPLGAALLRAVRVAGPPAEVLLRLLGLAGLGLAALAAHRLCAEAGSSRRAGLLAASTVATSGALLLAAARATAAAPLLGAEALVVLATLSAARAGGPARALGLAAASALATALDLATLPLVAASAAVLLLASPRRPTAAGLAIAAAAGTLAGLLAGGLVPSVRPPPPEAWIPSLLDLSRQLLVAGEGEGFSGPAHGFVALAAPAYGLALLGLAASGAGKGTAPGARLLGLGLAASGLATVLLHGPEGHGGGAGSLLLPGLLVLGSLRLGRAAPGPDRAFWVLLLVGASTLTGARVLASYRHEETRAAAALLAADERVVTPHRGLRLAVDFYRGEGGPGRTEPVRLFRPGDREPRLVAVHALGRRLGRLWVVRPGGPLHDLGARLPEAEVTYTERGRARPCPWQEGKARFHCGGPEYQQVIRSGGTFDGVEAEAVHAHPLDDGVLEIRYRAIPLGSRLVGVAGLDDSSFEFSTAEVDLEVRVAGGAPLRLRRGRARGLVPFALDTSRGPRRGDVAFLVSARDDRGRHFFFDALTME